MRVAKSSRNDLPADCACAACGRRLPPSAFSRSQLGKDSPKCRACVESALKEQETGGARSRRCAQCFRDLPRAAFSKRQYHQPVAAKCISCVEELEKAASSTQSTGKWSYDRYYRVCHKGRSGGVSVRVKCNIASPIGGHIPFGRVFRATHIIFNEQGDPMVKIESLSSDVVVVASAQASAKSDESVTKHRDGWVPCRSIRNEVLLEPHHGPFRSDSPQSNSRFYRCVIEGCKARVLPDLSLSEIGYVLYGDVVEVVEAVVTDDGIVFLRLHARYFDGAAWVVERTLDNESVLNAVEGPSDKVEQYRCVQESGAPLRLEPSLSSPPVGRVSCGAVVTVLERVVNAERQVFLRLRADANPQIALVTASASGDVSADTTTVVVSDVWVIETSTCCASVMAKVLSAQGQFR